MRDNHYIKHRALVSAKWAETKDIMATHIYGKPPRRILVNRRPIESENEYALKYRLSNFQPITRQPFLTAIDNISEAAQHIYAPEKNLSDQSKIWLENNRVLIAERKVSLRDLITKHLPMMAEADPNAALVVLPKHPTTELEYSYQAELPDFNNVMNQFVDIELALIDSDDIHYVDEELIIFKYGDWHYDTINKEEKYAPLIIQLSAAETILHIPVRNSQGGYDYQETIWYVNDLELPPFAVIGNNLVIGLVDGHIVTYSDGTYPGAVAIMNEVLAVKSDSQVVDTRFTYPEKVVQYHACGIPGATVNRDTTSPYYNMHVVYAEDGNCKICPGCNGSGKVAPDTSPLGSHILLKSDMFDDDGKFIPPIQFITPPLQSAEYLDQKWRLDFSEGKRALFILDQNMTNQAAASKAYDVKQKVSVITGAVKNVYRVYGIALNSIQGYLGGDQDVYLEMPLDYNVKTSEDITMELSTSANVSSTYTQELTRELLLKKFGNDADSQRAIEFLMLKDKLFGFNMDQILKAKAIYGDAITAADQYIHDKGFAILKKILEQVENFAALSDSELMALFDAEINAIFPVPPEVSIA